MLYRILAYSWQCDGTKRKRPLTLCFRGANLGLGERPHDTSKFVQVSSQKIRAALLPVHPPVCSVGERELPLLETASKAGKACILSPPFFICWKYSGREKSDQMEKVAKLGKFVPSLIKANRHTHTHRPGNRWVITHKPNVISSLERERKNQIEGKSSGRKLVAHPWARPSFRSASQCRSISLSLSLELAKRGKAQRK